MRMLSDARKKLAKELGPEGMKAPETRLAYQVTDLVYLRSALISAALLTPELDRIIDDCIKGWVFLYQVGATYNSIPDVVYTDPLYLATYNAFSTAFSQLQAFMSMNMSLLEKY